MLRSGQSQSHKPKEPNGHSLVLIGLVLPMLAAPQESIREPTVNAACQIVPRLAHVKCRCERIW